MTANKLKEVLELAKAWPEAAQAELAERAREIDAGLGTGKYHATPEELGGIDRGLKAAREGRFATDERIEKLFKKHRPAKRLSTPTTHPKTSTRFLPISLPIIQSSTTRF
jgi:hypothetical protein